MEGALGRITRRIFDERKRARYRTSREDRKKLGPSAMERKGRLRLRRWAPDRRKRDGECSPKRWGTDWVNGRGRGWSSQRQLRDHSGSKDRKRAFGVEGAYSTRLPCSSCGGTRRWGPIEKFGESRACREKGIQRVLVTTGRLQISERGVMASEGDAKAPPTGCLAELESSKPRHGELKGLRETGVRRFDTSRASA